MIPSPRVSTFVLASLLVFASPYTYPQSAPPIVVEKPETNAEPAVFRFSGTITAKREADLSPRVAGLISVADAETGFAAEKGAVLVRLDDTLAKIELREQELALEGAQAENANTERRLNEAVELGDANFPRTERETRETAFRLSQVAVQQAANALERQREIVKRHQIIAPFEGIVVSKDAEVGEWVQTGNPVLHFVGTSDLRLDIEVPQEQLDVILQTQSVSVYLSKKHDQPINAQIEARSPKVNPNTRTFLVRLALDNPPKNIKPGMSAEGSFRPATGINQLVISRDAIIRYSDGRTIVWVVNNSGGESRTEQRDVELGNTRGTRIEVVSGLKKTDLVVVRGNESLQEDQLVTVTGSLNTIKETR